MVKVSVYGFARFAIAAWVIGVALTAAAHEQVSKSPAGLLQNGGVLAPQAGTLQRLDIAGVATLVGYNGSSAFIFPLGEVIQVRGIQRDGKITAIDPTASPNDQGFTGDELTLCIAPVIRDRAKFDNELAGGKIGPLKGLRTAFLEPAIDGEITFDITTSSGEQLAPPVTLILGASPTEIDIPVSEKLRRVAPKKWIFRQRGNYWAELAERDLELRVKSYTEIVHTSFESLKSKLGDVVVVVPLGGEVTDEAKRLATVTKVIELDVLTRPTTRPLTSTEIFRDVFRDMANLVIAEGKDRQAEAKAIVFVTEQGLIGLAVDNVEKLGESDYSQLESQLASSVSVGASAKFLVWGGSANVATSNAEAKKTVTAVQKAVQGKLWRANGISVNLSANAAAELVKNIRIAAGTLTTHVVPFAHHSTFRAKAVSFPEGPRIADGRPCWVENRGGFGSYALIWANNDEVIAPDLDGCFRSSLGRGTLHPDGRITWRDKKNAMNAPWLPAGSAAGVIKFYDRGLVNRQCRLELTSAGLAFTTWEGIQRVAEVSPDRILRNQYEAHNHTFSIETGSGSIIWFAGPTRVNTTTQRVHFAGDDYNGAPHLQLK